MANLSYGKVMVVPIHGPYLRSPLSLVPGKVEPVFAYL